MELNYKIKQKYNLKYNPELYYNLKLISSKYYIYNNLILKISSIKFKYSINKLTKYYLTSSNLINKKIKLINSLINNKLKSKYLLLNLYLTDNINNCSLFIINNKIFIYTKEELKLKFQNMKILKII